MELKMKKKATNNPFSWLNQLGNTRTATPVRNLSRDMMIKSQEPHDQKYHKD
jgi:hypothetical protein